MAVDVFWDRAGVSGPPGDDTARHQAAFPEDKKEDVMFHHRHDKNGSLSPIASPPVKTVRLLNDEAELQEALERAKGYESRGFDEYKRRMGAYDRFLTRGQQGRPDNVLPIEPSAEAS
jgi:hypothetical protein